MPLEDCGVGVDLRNAAQQYGLTPFGNHCEITAEHTDRKKRRRFRVVADALVVMSVRYASIRHPLEGKETRPTRNDSDLMLSPRSLVGQKVG